jgi:hypothetical protein|tara:strand:- start:16 stop:183 length:168 start_codon:yes stop_codon:yes gene_type:complete
VLYYKGNQKEVNMITILMTLFFACGEEKTEDSAQPVEEQEEQQESVEDTAEEAIV